MIKKTKWFRPMNFVDIESQNSTDNMYEQYVNQIL